MTPDDGKSKFINGTLSNILIMKSCRFKVRFNKLPRATVISMDIRCIGISMKHNISDIENMGINIRFEKMDNNAYVLK